VRLLRRVRVGVGLRVRVGVRVKVGVGVRVRVGVRVGRGVRARIVVRDRDRVSVGSSLLLSRRVRPPSRLINSSRVGIAPPSYRVRAG
jgi:hypothetical protein